MRSTVVTLTRVARSTRPVQFARCKQALTLAEVVNDHCEERDSTSLSTHAG